MRRVAFIGTIGMVLALAATAYAAVITCDGGRCQGTDEADQITGSLGPDAIFADAGADDVEARAGQDYAQGATGADQIIGGRGEDALRGDRGNDVIDGGPGDDNIFGGPSLGSLTPSGDVFVFEHLEDLDPNDADAVYGGRGDEGIRVDDGDGDDYVDCGPGEEDFVFGDKGDVIENCGL